MTSLSNEERERRRARYFWDTRRTTDDPDTEGYGWDDERMFRDLERVEATTKAALKVVQAADWLYAAIEEAHAKGETFGLRVSTTGASFRREREALAKLEVEPK
jgi:hypothetical protein